MPLDISAIPLLDNVTLPEGLQIQTVTDPSSFMQLKGQHNSSTPQYFGTAFRQGNRLHFSTAMAVRDYVKLVEVDHANKGSSLEESKEHSNRPREAAHGKKIGSYLAETACKGLPWIFPAFILNYGIGYTDDMSKADLVIFAGTRDALAWPAIFTPPATGGMPVTDGGHRTDEIKTKLDLAAGRLPENALSVTFVFEDDEVMYHQDFADCAKAKAISNSLSGSWDRRDAAKKFGINLVESNQYLRRLIDATSNSVNLSTNSTKAWSMSALQAAVSNVHITEGGNSARLSSYFDLLFTNVPIMKDVAGGISPAKFRTAGRGGCVLLRGVGVAVLLQSFKHATEHGVAFDEMAKKMATVDWFVLKDGAPPQDSMDAHSYTGAHAQPIWLGMLAMMAGSNTFRIKGTRDAAENAFTLLRPQLGL